MSQIERVETEDTIFISDGLFTSVIRKEFCTASLGFGVGVCDINQLTSIRSVIDLTLVELKNIGVK